MLNIYRLKVIFVRKLLYVRAHRFKEYYIDRYSGR